MGLHIGYKCKCQQYLVSGEVAAGIPAVPGSAPEVVGVPSLTVRVEMAFSRHHPQGFAVRFRMRLGSLLLRKNESGRP